MIDFQIARDDLHRCRVVDARPRELEDGQARLSVERFGLTANNITYAKFGEAMSYWNFFPAEEGWGQGYGTIRGKPFIRLSIHPSRSEEAAHGFVRAFEVAAQRARRA